MIIKSGTQLFEAQKVGIEPASANFVATWLGQLCFFEPCQEGTHNHDRTPQPTNFCYKVIRIQKRKINI